MAKRRLAGMNYLGHLLLAERTGTSLAGSILGDVVRGSDLDAYPEPLRVGIHLHRQVDAATDRHPLLDELRDRFAEGQRRYAGIVLDIVCDHALTQDWQCYCDEPLLRFCVRAGAAVAAAGIWFEHAGGTSRDAGAFAQLLRSYREPAGIDIAFARTAARMRQPQGLLAAAADWQQWLPALRALLPALLSSVATQALDRMATPAR